MASRSRKNQPGGRPNFPWYTFPHMVSFGVLSQWNGRLEWMKQRNVHVPVVVNWGWIEQVGLLEGIEPIFGKSFDGLQGRFMCIAWRRLFQIQEIIYKELVIEFLATISFRRKIGALKDGNLNSCLGGEKRELSLVELVIRMEIYLSSEVHTEYYIEFITGTI